MIKKISIANLIVLLIMIFAGCDDGKGNTNLLLTQSSDSATDLVYEGLNMELQNVTGMYQLAVGPFDVSKYKQIRLSTFGNSGSGTILVTVSSVESLDPYAETLGLIENITIDFSSSDTTYLTRVYDIPGQFIMINFQSLNHDWVSCVIYRKK